MNLYLIHSAKITVKINRFPDDIIEKTGGAYDTIILYPGKSYFNRETSKFEVITNINITKQSIHITTDSSTDDQYGVEYYDNIYTLVENFLRSKIYQKVSLSEKDCTLTIDPTKYICICEERKSKKFIKASNQKFIEFSFLDTKSSADTKSPYEYIARLTDNSINCSMNISVNYHYITKYGDNVYKIDNDPYKHIEIDYLMEGLDIYDIIMKNA